MKKLLITLLIFSSIILVNCSKNAATFSHQPSSGYVPDDTTAIKIAEAIWLPVYGKTIYNCTPFVAELKNGVWIVTGTLHTDFGGTPYIEIRKKDCLIMRMSHEK